MIKRLFKVAVILLLLTVGAYYIGLGTWDTVVDIGGFELIREKGRNSILTMWLNGIMIYCLAALTVLFSLLVIIPTYEYIVNGKL